MKIFVYGTLKKGHCRQHVLKNQKFIQYAETSPNYRLYNCGSYPGLVESDTGVSIKGELWEVDEECKELLDAIEGVPYLYKLQSILLNGVNDEVFSYFFQLNTSNLEDCGDCWNGD